MGFAAMNDYSDEWFAYFLKEVPEEKTKKEVAFLARQFKPGSSLLDLCCGDGRHTAPLALQGFSVLGIDRNEGALRRAEKRGSSANFVLGDVRNYQLPKAQGAYCLWQSFGYFTSGENRRILESWHNVLVPGSRLILDVYNRDFFLGKDGVRSTGGITESKRLKGKRLEVHLAYPNGKQDRFDWELFTLEELEKAAKDSGFTLEKSCTRFEESTSVSKDEPRMQLVFEA